MIENFWTRGMHRGVVLLVLVLMISNRGFGQSPMYGKQRALDQYSNMTENWSYGSIQVDSKTKLQGSLKYNSFENVLTIKTTEGQRTFNAQNVQRFDYTDAGMHRYFISSPARESNEEMPQRYFFEVLKECKHFALLCREINYVIKSANTNPYMMGATTSYSVNITKEETFYFFDDQGKIRPYMMINSKEKTGLNLSRARKVHMIDRKLIREYTKDFYPQLKAYAKEFHLSFKKRDELIKILDFYKKQEKDEEVAIQN